MFGVLGDRVSERRVTITRLLRELERVEREASTDPLRMDEAAVSAQRQEHTELWAQQHTTAAAQQPSQLQTTQRSRTEQRQQPDESTGPSGHRPPPATSSAVKHSCTDPNVVHSCRWTELEKEEEKRARDTQTRSARSSGGGGTVEAITDKVKQWTAGGGNEPSETSGQWTSGSGGGLGAALGGVKEAMGVAGEKVSEAASGIQEKVGERFGDFKSSRPFSR